VLGRLFALCILVALIGGGLYYWKHGGSGLPEVEDLGEVGGRLKDATTTGAVKGAFELNRHLAPLEIEVETEDGVVTLRGRVPGEETRRLAEKVAGSVPNVAQVVNHLKVSGREPETRPGSDRTLGESLDDRALEVRLHLAFSLDRNLDGANLKVKAYRREVVLTGEVLSDRQRAEALRIARDLPGVIGVTDQLRTIAEAQGRVPLERPPRNAVEAVRQALADNANLARYHLEVREDGGRLVVSGAVRTGAEKDLAELLARQAAGRDVTSRIRLAGPQTE
jgi:hyperosmotically inducible periplasmic protein